MARDPVAITIQGPDNASGNPLAVSGSMTPSGTQDINIKQVGGTNVPLLTLAGLLATSPVDITGNGTTFAADGVKVSIPTIDAGWDGTAVQPAANTAATITIAGVAGKRVYIGHITAQFSGANAAVNLTASDGVNRFLAVIQAATNNAVHFTFPGGGLRFSVGAAVTITLPAGGAGVIGTLNAGTNQY